MSPSLTLDLSLSRPSAVVPSPHVLQVAAMFGLGIDADRSVTIIPPIKLQLAGGRLVFITGPSGSGKSSLLHLIADALRNHEAARVINMNDTATPSEGWSGASRVATRPRLCRDNAGESDRPLVDCFGGLPLDRVLSFLSLAGLNDAFVMLRRPAELSDGQRYRLRLAHAMQLADADAESSRLTVVLADEFGATLDRLTAAVIARNVRKWVSRHEQLCFIAATTHDDLLEHLEPDVLVEKHLGASIEVLNR